MIKKNWQETKKNYKIREGREVNHKSNNHNTEDLIKQNSMWFGESGFNILREAYSYKLSGIFGDP